MTGEQRNLGNRRRILSLIIVLALAVLSVSSSVSPASADITYCGHGSSGIWHYQKYVSSYKQDTQHIHKVHHAYGIADPYVGIIACNPH